MRLISLILIVLWNIGCSQEKSLDYSHEVIGAVALNEKAPYFEIVLLATHTDTLWIDFWENNLDGDWVRKDGKVVNLKDAIGNIDFDHLKNQYSRPLILNQSLLPDEITLVDPLDFKEQIDYQYYKISTPAFTNDGRYSIIYWEDVCHMDCGGGGFFVYRKNKHGIWERFLSRYLWMS